MPDQQNTIGIIGGTGLYELPGFENAQWVTVESAFGEPSDQLLIGEPSAEQLKVALGTLNQPDPARTAIAKGLSTS